MAEWTRRAMLGGAVLAGGGLLAGCTSGRPQSSTREAIDARVDEAIRELFTTVPGSEQVAQNAQGMLVIARIRGGGFFLGGAYGEGALMIGDARVDYYSMARASLGLQIGVSEFNQALFFMTSQALQEFRMSDGWELGAGAEVATPQGGAAAGLTTTTSSRPVIELVYGQRGLLVGASLAGAKYNRLIR